MGATPYLDELSEWMQQHGYSLTDSEKAMIATCQYMVTLLILLSLFWLLRNAWVILIKNRKYTVLPLLTFYVLAFLLIVFRIYTEFWLW